jgi:hypothetical protein
MTLSDTAGVPRVVILNGKEYQISELTIADLAQFERRLVELKKEYVREYLKDVDSADRVKMIMDAKNVNVFAEMSKMESLQYLLWLALRKTDSKITAEQAGALVTMENVGDIQVALLGESVDEGGSKNQ